jgi:hypothetical protein
LTVFQDAQSVNVFPDRETWQVCVAIIFGRRFDSPMGCLLVFSFMSLICPYFQVKFLFATIDKCWALLQPGGYLVIQSMLCKVLNFATEPLK